MQNPIVSNNMGHRTSPILPIAAYLLAVIVWPKAGAGNNGHCDAWYYWGMSHSPEIALNTLSLEYYPGSRAPLYILGWILPSELDPILWSKILMAITSFIPSLLFFLIFPKSKQRSAFTSFFLASLLPIMFSQFSANYAAITFNLIVVLGMALFFGSNTKRSLILIGFLAGLIFFANAETLVLVPAFLVLIISRIQSQKIVQISILLAGVIFSYFFLVLILSLTTFTIQQSLSFPLQQIYTLINVTGDTSFFGTLDNPWYRGTPLLMFHLALICFLNFKSIRSRELFPRILTKVLSIQLFFLTLAQLTGFAVTFQSGFDAVIAFWICPIIIFYALNDEKIQSKSFIFVLSLSYFMFLFLGHIVKGIFSNKSTFFFTNLFSLALPVSAFMLLILYMLSKPSNYKILASLLLVMPLFSYHIFDYSAAFFSGDNMPFGYDKMLTTYEYDAASQSIRLFENSLKGTTAIGAIENTSDQLEVMMLRSSARAFSSCGFQWSSLQDFSELRELNVNNWPNHMLFISGKKLTEKEIRSMIPNLKILNFYKFQVAGRTLYWNEIFKS